jgi:hypothetical protein
MDLYRCTHEEFFFACAFARNSFGIFVLPLERIEKWLSENEIQDFTVAYMMGSEI